MNNITHSEETEHDQDNIPFDDSIIAEMPLRSSGWVGYSDDAIVINDDECKKIHTEDVAEIGLRTLQWDIAVMSILLVGVGGYIVLTRNPFIGLCFALVGLGSLYRTYTHRQALVIQIRNHQKPVIIHPTNPETCHDKLAETAELNQVR